MLKEHPMLYIKQNVCGNLGHKMVPKIVGITLVLQAGLMQTFFKIGLKKHCCDI